MVRIPLWQQKLRAGQNLTCATQLGNWGSGSRPRCLMLGEVQFQYDTTDESLTCHPHSLNDMFADILFSPLLTLVSFSSLIDCRQHIGRTHLLFFHFPHFSEHYVPNTGRVTIMGDTRDTIMNKIDTCLPSEGVQSNGMIIFYDFLNLYYALSFVFSILQMSILRCWE